MREFSVFLQLPSNDDWVLKLSESKDLQVSVLDLLGCLARVSKNANVHFYYDSKAMNSIVDKLGVLEDYYLNSFALQVKVMLSGKASSINSSWQARHDVSFYLWDKTNACVSFVTEVLPKYMLDLGKKDSCLYVFDKSFFIVNEDQSDFIIDSNEDGYPKLVSIPSFEHIDDAASWIACRCDISNLLYNRDEFERTGMIYRRNGSMQRVYRKMSDSSYWYLDFFHKDNTFHYEVFNKNGKHLGTADRHGRIDSKKADSNKEPYFHKIMK